MRSGTELSQFSRNFLPTFLCQTDQQEFFPGSVWVHIIIFFSVKEKLNILVHNISS